VFETIGGRGSAVIKTLANNSSDVVNWSICTATLQCLHSLTQHLTNDGVSNTVLEVSS